MVVNIPFYKNRPYHAFLSYSHTDEKIVDDLASWLSRICNIPIWYDKYNLVSSSQIANELPNVLIKCRSIIIVLSKNSVESGWVNDEYNFAIGQRSSTKGEFRIIPVLIEECEIPGFLTTTKYIDLRNGTLDIDIAKQILSGIYYRDYNVNPDSRRDLFISRSWNAEESSLPDYVCKIMSIKTDFRLIGDAPDQENFDENRLKSIMENCGVYVAILPYRETGRDAGKTSRYIIREIIIAKKIGLPSLIVAESNVEISKLNLSEDIKQSIIQLDKKNTQGSIFELSNSIINDFVEEWKEPTRSKHIFFATASKNVQINEIIREHIQRITAIPCITENQRTGQKTSKDIAKTISTALIMIADISEYNYDTLIEIGIALGTDIPVYLIAREREPSHTLEAFMLHDIPIYWYKDDIQLLGMIHRITYEQTRRQVFDFSH